VDWVTESFVIEYEKYDEEKKKKKQDVCTCHADIKGRKPLKKGP